MTKDYTFEYTKESSIYGLLGLSISILTVGFLFLSLPYSYHQTIANHPFLATIGLLAISVSFFLLNKKRLRRYATATLSDGAVEFDLITPYNISFNDLKYYFKRDGKNELAFTFGLLNGKKFHISANNNFCNEEEFTQLIADMESAIEKYKQENNIDIIHLESVFQKRKVVFVLIPLTILVIVSLFFTKMPLTILPAAFCLPLLVGWIRYFVFKSSNKLVDI